MSIITSITEQKKKSRVNIYLDGRFFCGLEKLTCVSNNLQVGTEISKEQLEEIQQQSEQSVAFSKSLDFLSSRMRSEAEIKKYLAGKGYLPLTIENTISKLKEYSYINDEEFANQLIRSYPSLGQAALKQKLIQKGVPQNTIKSFLESIDAESEEEKAEIIAKKYLKNRINSKNIKQKLNNHLISKGFSFEIASKLTKKFTAEEDNEY